MKLRVFRIRVSAMVLLVAAILALMREVSPGAPEALSQVSTSKVGVAIAEVKALRDTAKFTEARDALRKAVSQYASEPDVQNLRDLETTIRGQVRDFMGLTAEIEQLSASSPTARKVAVERLLGEDVGRIVLRQTVKEGPVPAAVAAGRGLAETKDSAGIQAVLARAKIEKTAGGAAELLGILPDVARFISIPDVQALGEWAQGKTDAIRAPVSELMKRRTTGAVDATELKAVADLAVGADSPARRAAMEFMAITFRFAAKRNSEAFNKLFGDDRYTGLLAALEKDRAAADGQLSGWARRQWFSMLRIDRDALAKGLHARWTLDTLGQGQFNDSGPSGRNLNAKNLDARLVVPGILGKALACTNENVTVEWGDRAYRELQTNDFSLTAWVKVLNTKPTAGDPESVILGSESGGRTSGLVLGTNGIVHFLLPVMTLPPAPPAPPPPPPVDPKKAGADKKKKEQPSNEQNRRPVKRTLELVDVATTQPLATNRWYHLAAAVSRSSNEVTLYVNGEFAANRAAATNATPGEVNGSLRVGSAKGQTKERRVSCCFQGLIDDIRVYSRVITETDAAILFAQSEVEP